MKRQVLFILASHGGGGHHVAAGLGGRGIALNRLFGGLRDAVGGATPRDVCVSLLNERILHALGSSSDSVDPLADDWRKSLDAAEALVKAVRAAIRKEPCMTTVLGLDDPPLCLLLPLWLDAVRSLGYEAFCVLVLRRSAAAVQSLKTTDATPEIRTALLCVKYLTAAERKSRGLPRVFVLYHRLLQDWRSVVTEISEKSGAHFPIDIESAAREIDSFLEPTLRHYADEADFSDDEIGRLAQEAYEELSMLNPGTALLDEYGERLSTFLLGNEVWLSEPRERERREERGEKEQRAESREQRAESREQRAESREQRAESTVCRVSWREHVDAGRAI